jgi:ketosteroid isomerase-like protein
MSRMRKMAMLAATAVAAGCAFACATPGDDVVETETAALGRGTCRDVRGDRLSMVVVDRLASALTQVLGPDGFLALVDDDIAFEAPAEPILRGRAAVRDYFTRTDPGGAIQVSWRITRADVGRSGDVGYTFGWTTERSVAADGTAVVRHGKFMNVWRRRGGHGTWRLIGHGRVRAVDIVPEPAPEGLTFFPDDGHRCLPAADRDASRTAMIAADNAFAALSRSDGVAAAFGTYVADDGVLLAAGAQLIFGRDAVIAVYADTPPNESLDWGAVLGEIATSGDIGFTMGTATYTVADPAGDQHFYSKYLTVWERQPSGAWRFVADGGSARPGP